MTKTQNDTFLNFDFHLDCNRILGPAGIKILFKWSYLLVYSVFNSHLNWFEHFLWHSICTELPFLRVHLHYKLFSSLIIDFKNSLSLSKDLSTHLLPQFHINDFASSMEISCYFQFHQIDLHSELGHSEEDHHFLPSSDCLTWIAIFHTVYLLRDITERGLGHYFQNRIFSRLACWLSLRIYFISNERCHVQCIF